MSEHKKLYTLLQMIGLLSRPGGFGVQRLARRFGVTQRTIYRYFHTLKECGFELEKRGDRYRFKPRNPADNLLPLLSGEETALLRDAVLGLPSAHPQKTELLKKLRILADPAPLAELIVNASAAGVVRNLLDAIREKREVVLKNYQSPNSNTIRDRRVEPLGFSVNLKYLHAYEPEQKSVLQFKPERIGSVVVTRRTFKEDERHRIRKPDLFGMNGTPKSRISLRLNRRAASLLLEEFPESGEYFHGKDLTGFENLSGLELELFVHGFEGVGRFVLGLPGEAEALGPPEFLRYIEKRMKRDAPTLRSQKQGDR